MDVLQQIGNCGLLPRIRPAAGVNAVSLAKAVLAGGINVAEVDFCEGHGLDWIKEISKGCPGLCVGAGGVSTLQETKSAADSGARFIITDSVGRELADWCAARDIAVIPSCSTPAQIEEAAKLQLGVVGILSAGSFKEKANLERLSDTFRPMKFIPSPNASESIEEYGTRPYTFAVRVDTLGADEKISPGNFEAVTAKFKMLKAKLLGYSFEHLGINCLNPETAKNVCGSFHSIFDFPVVELKTSNFVTGNIEVTKSMFPGEHGHIAIRTANIDRAIADLKDKGVELDMATAGYRNGAMISVYLKENIGGFAVHLLQR